MILHLNLTEDHLKLVKFLNIEDINDDYLTIDKNTILTMQTHILDDVALILGLRDKAIKNTEEDADGAAYPNDVEKYMLDTYRYVQNNLYLIETLLHQKVMEGIKPNTEYVCKDNEMVWTEKNAQK